MGERKANYKRDVEDAEREASITSFTSSKRIRHGDSIDFDYVVGSSSPASAVSSAASTSGGSSASSTDENNDQSSSIFFSGCSSSEMSEIAQGCLTFIDLEAHHKSETEISTCIINNFRKERSPASDSLGETEEMDSAAATAEDLDRKKSTAASKSPTQAELEEFFSAAEKYEQKRFTEKYNYDVVRDVPLEGRYQWLRLKP